MSKGNLKSKAIAGMLWSGIQRFGTLTLSFITNLILARMLTPDDFGCIGMLAIFIALSQTFIDGGFGAALIQKSEPTQRDYSTIFYWNVALSAMLYTLLCMASPYIAAFYDVPLLEQLLKAMGLVLILDSLSIIHRNRLRKQLKFNIIALVDVCASLLSVSIAIISAYKGLGVWSLIVYQLTMSMFRTSGYVILHRWHPSLQFDMNSFKTLFRFGGFLLVSDLLNTLCDNIQGLIIGKKFAPSVMGYYAQAKKLEEVPTTSISSIVAQVTFPVFSALKDEPSRLQVAHRRCIQSSNYLNIPLMALLIVVAEPLFVLLFTEKWLPSVPYFRILCFAGLANCLQSINYQLFVAMGYSKQMFRWNVVKRSIGVLLILSGACIGIEGILWGMVAGFWITYSINAGLAGSVTGYTLLKQLKDILPMSLAAFVCCGVAYAESCIWKGASLALMAVQAVSFVTAYVLLSFLLKIDAMSVYRQVIANTYKSIKEKLCKPLF